MTVARVFDPTDLTLRIVRGSCCAFAFVMSLSITANAVETRSYVISKFQTATYSNEGNCPHGGNGTPSEIKERILIDQGYTKQQVDYIISHEGRDENGNRVNTGTRGRLNGEPAYVGNFPNSIPDPQIETVQGKFAYGFNLDGRVQSDSFQDPETLERGIDNQRWRALGCFAVYDVRRPVVPYNEYIAWDTAIDAMPAWLMSVTGDDLDKDGDVTVTFDRSLNILLRDAQGSVLPGATFVVDSDPRSHSSFQGQIENGVLTIEPGDFAMLGESQWYAIIRFAQTHLRLKMNSDGSLSGLIGGYQPWLDLYYFLAVRGEESGQVDLPGVYYAFERLADGIPDPVTGQNTAISSAFWMEAVPAFLTTVSGRVIGEAVQPNENSHVGDVALSQ